MYQRLRPSDVSIVGLTVKFTVQKIAPKKNVRVVKHEIFLETSSFFSAVCISKWWASSSNGIFRYMSGRTPARPQAVLSDCVVVPISIHEFLYFVCFCGGGGRGWDVNSLRSGDKYTKSKTTACS